VLVCLLAAHPECADIIKCMVDQLLAQGVDIPSIEQIVRLELANMDPAERAQRRQAWEAWVTERSDAEFGARAQRLRADTDAQLREAWARVEAEMEEIASSAALDVRRIGAEADEAVSRIRSQAEAEVQRIGAAAQIARQQAEAGGFAAEHVALIAREGADVVMRGAGEHAAKSTEDARRFREERDAIEQKARQDVMEAEERARRVREETACVPQHCVDVEACRRQRDAEARRVAAEIEETGRRTVEAKRLEAEAIERRVEQERRKADEDRRRQQEETDREVARVNAETERLRAQRRPVPPVASRQLAHGVAPQLGPSADTGHINASGPGWPVGQGDGWDMPGWGDTQPPGPTKLKGSKANKENRCNPA
jgi:hypothetical protein